VKRLEAIPSAQEDPDEGRRSGTTYTAPVAGGSHLGQTAVYDPFGNLTTLELLTFSEADAAILRDALNEEEGASPNVDQHGSVFGDRMRCSKGSNGDNFCG
jgi:hypothetical protein